MRMLWNGYSRTWIATMAACTFCLAVTGCGNVENRAEKVSQGGSADSACKLIREENWDAARRDFTKLRTNILGSNLDRKFFISAKIGQLAKDSSAVSNGDVGRKAQLNIFCVGVANGVPIAKLAEDIKTRNKAYNPSDYAKDSAPGSQSSDAKESNSAITNSRQEDISETIKNGLRFNCTNLPQRFNFMRIQEREGTFNNYGEPLRLFTVGNLLLSVYNQGSSRQIGPGDGQSQVTLNDWECIFPFTVRSNG